ncbi:Holliday junction ATP-dependent DNA helicase RuvA [bioreactor metagenome]|jgi:Holliday junction DNA helicase RuvA|uniref:Holliday junction ATP-dependent DNA helicase RuvA n=1 Tax=bioreactor metagenome TaxID=1076179 RepID=A0A644VMH2_9ZZZZ|nr:Holliday junction branch migration protein RuvA [Paludibacter sp.]
MIDYIKGEITELNPTYAVVETAGIGYFINIALPVYSVLNGQKTGKLYIYEAIREDAYNLYGFLNQADRQLFLMLISVSGIGANTARMIMSSYAVAEIQQMIATGNAVALSSIKGIGAKTAQRIIVDLKDKIIKLNVISDIDLPQQHASGEVREEAVSALVMLGFAANVSQKAVDGILKSQSDVTVEQLIKLALKNI